MKNKEQEEYENLKQQLSKITVSQNLIASNQPDFINKCEHEIVLLLGYKQIRPGIDMYNSIPIYKCLFCDTEKNSNVNLKKSIIIDSSNYLKDVFDMNSEEASIRKFKVIRNIIFETVQENNDITNVELQTMINQSLNGYSYIKK